MATARLATEKADFRPALLLPLIAGLLPEKMMTTYSEKLRDPRWQKRRLEVMNRAGFACETCQTKEKTLNVNHKIYRKGHEPWEYEDHELECLCEDCHAEHHRFEKRIKEALVGEYVTLAKLVGYADACAIMCNPDQPEKYFIALESHEYSEGVADAAGLPIDVLLYECGNPDGKITGRDLWDAREKIWHTTRFQGG